MNQKERADKLHKKVRNFMLTCVGSDGYPLTKAVVPGKYRESIKELYFTTNTSSNFIKAIQDNNKGSVYFYHKVFFSWKGCNLKGNFEVINDMELKRKYWVNLYKNAYPEKSYIDPDFCLVKFTPVSGRIYANFKTENFDFSARD